MQDFFLLFGLQQAFSIDEKALEKKYFELQREYHPDRFAGKQAPERISALNKSTEITNGYQLLRSPLKRAGYLLAKHGIMVNGEHDNVKPDADLLMEMMEIRERLEEGGIEEIESLEIFAETEIKKSLQDLEQDFAADDFQKAAQDAMRMRYLTKFSEEIRLKKKTGAFT